MMAALAERNQAPIKVDLVQLGAGVWCEDTPAAGFLSTQGIVEVNGKQDRFDQLIGQGWIIIGYNADPAAALNEEQLAALHYMEGKTVTIGSPGSVCDAQDIEGTYAKWMTDIGASYCILRPDFYVAATARSANDLSRRFTEVMGKLPRRVN
ncbi:MAG: hypothetical protein ACPGSM_21090, partial [Thiolinea sp.]